MVVKAAQVQQILRNINTEAPAYLLDKQQQVS